MRRTSKPTRKKAIELDDDQRKAVEAAGPVVITAGPGTGKTRTLVARIAHQLETGTVAPERVLAIAFTNQAADELAARIRRYVPGATEIAPVVTTFHGFGLRLLTEMSGTPPAVVDDHGRTELVRSAAGGDMSEREARALIDRISLAKQSCDPWQVLADERQMLPVMSRYQDLLDRRHAVDVDDLVLRPYQLLATDPMASERLARRWDSVCVDEYQDVNDVQAELVRLLSPDGTTLCVIGDPDQAIYGFRGSRPGHFARFADSYPDTTQVRLKTSYRLTAEVSATARAVVGSRTGDLRPAGTGPRVEIVPCPTPASEAEQIVVRLERLIGGTSIFAVDSGRGGEAEATDLGFGDVAVLSRTKSQRAEILEALGRSGIPCHSVGEDQPHDPRSEKVAVMTMHAAKGREFGVVFVAGVEEGLMPLEREGLTSDPDEERRLLYVAMTRARHLLVISHSARRTLWGKRLPGKPSPFIADLPEASIKQPKPSMPKSTAPSSQMRLF